MYVYVQEVYHVSQSVHVHAIRTMTTDNQHLVVFVQSGGVELAAEGPVFELPGGVEVGVEPPLELCPGDLDEDGGVVPVAPRQTTSLVSRVP